MKKQKKAKFIIGVTGSFGSGKSTVAKMLRNFLNASLIDADKIAHRVLKDSWIKNRLIDFFGREIVNKNNRIDTQLLGKIAFKNKRNLVSLNKITHPKIIRTIKNEINRSQKSIIILDAPLLIESNLYRIVDKIVVVKTDIKKQILRLKKRGFCADEIKRRIRFQIHLREKLRFADFVIDNNGRLEQTKRQIRKILGRLKYGENRKTRYR
ncbi:MAG: dephospho-CoA kinase [Candidatus Omnitrophica bacterium]|nr:dephospho-CoA kinase [Candidatus Omnitrophota bacterium]